MVAMNDYSTLVLGVVCAGIGGELFVRGVVGLSRWARISPGIIGATVAAFATSSPELSVSVRAALAGTPQIGLGDALGSNIVNIAFVLGFALVFAGMQSPRDSVRRDFPMALLTPVITGILFLDGVLSRLDGILMLLMFIAWLVATSIEARKQRSAAGAVLGESHLPLMILSCAVGLAFLVTAGKFIVAGARGLAIDFGIDEFVVGATIVAFGTSAPEIATTVIARVRGHDEVSLGTILGSNIFNGLAIVPIAAIIHPIVVSWREIALALVFGLVSLACTCPTPAGSIERWRGVLLLILYAFYITIIIQLQST
jgi:cation:H+ antiporter